MEFERPGDGYICKNNFDGTGRWVYDEIEKDKIKKTRAMGRPNFFNKLISKLYWNLYLVVAQDKYPSLGRILSFLNLLFPNNAHKKVSLSLFFLIAGHLIFFGQSDNVVIYNLEGSIFAGVILEYIFYVFNLFEKRQRVVNRFFDIFVMIVNIKNIQYISVGYQKNPIGIGVDWEYEALDTDSANQLEKLMVRNSGKSPIGELIALSGSHRNDESFKWASERYEKLIQELASIDGIDDFPEMSNLLRNIYQYTFSKEIKLGIPLSHEAGAQSYLIEYFRSIEKMELFFLLYMRMYLNTSIFWGVNFVRKITFKRKSYEWQTSGFPF
ncbi:hypothetical protein [Comamonas terrigena]|uniref:hypothetical protein n=1 Tax=Comamonas terrigena TaxID=32013 RepID=UPI002447FF02|nr:hypothetical protein [Comamonas terrigena]MDH1701674.1 hypothetical protein [Comamonas terrigena]